MLHSRILALFLLLPNKSVLSEILSVMQVIIVKYTVIMEL